METVREGDAIEVLWTLEMPRRDGRKRRKTVGKEVWWKAVLKKIDFNGGVTRAGVHYEEAYGMEAALMDARVMGSFLCHEGSGGKERVSQPWRMCPLALSESGNNDEVDSAQQFSNQSPGSKYKQCTGQMKESGRRITSMVLSIDPEKGEAEERISTLQVKIEELQRIVGAQGAIYSRIIGSWSESDKVSDRIFSFLRHRIVVSSHKPIVFPRTRSAISDVHEGKGHFVGMCYTSLIKAGADCSLGDFERIARVIKSRCANAVFQPAFVETQSPMQSLEHAQVIFNTLHELASCIGISGYSDLLSLLLKGRKMNAPDPAQLPEDCAFRLIGATLAEKDDDDHPFAFRVAGSLHQSLPNETCELLWRETRQFDTRNCRYVNRLCKKNMHIMDAIRESCLEMIGEKEPHTADHTRFTLSWAPLSNSKGRNFSKSLQQSNEVLGTLEMVWPALVVRNKKVVSEFQKTVTQDMLRRSIETSIQK